MLLHYKEAKEQKPEGYEIFLQGLYSIITADIDWKIFDNHSKGEYVRLKLFTISPWLYESWNKINEGVIIPFKQKRYFNNQEMIIICLSGGLGNQMFQYALYLYLKQKGNQVKIDDVTEYINEKKRQIQLDIFQCSYIKASKEEICHWTDSYMDFPSRIRRKLFGRKTKLYRDLGEFDNQVLELTNAYLYGWWQSEKYFKEIEKEIRQTFRFSDINYGEKNTEYLEKIRMNESVGVHVRRGDYLDADELYGGICTDDYYEKAMEVIKSQYPDSHFYIFTNDVLWAKEYMVGEHITVVEGNDELHGYYDMFLMSQCKHNIIANSSFSWWAAWLNENPNKLVIAPSRWMNGRESKDIYWDGMILI